MTREWLTQAACAGMADETYATADPFHPEPNRGTPDYRVARSICQGCPVRQECLTDAMDTETSGARAGFRGGLSPDERQRLYRRGLRGTTTAPPDEVAKAAEYDRRMEAYKLGMSDRETGEYLGITSDQVRWWRQYHGLKPNHAPGKDPATSCERMHDWTVPGNLRVRPNGRRVCVPCEQIRNRRKQDRQRAS